MAVTRDPSSWRRRTKLVRGGTKRSNFGENAEAIYMTSSFRYDTGEAAEARFINNDGFVYSRFANPTIAMLEERVALLEGAPAARALASGMAAVNAALMSQLRAGDHVVSARALFGSCRWILEDLCPRYGISVTFVDGRDLSQWQQAIRPETKVLFFETPTNPTLEIVDIRGVVKLAKACGAKTVIDNVFATPLFQRPMEMGVDVVVYSATKHMDGHGRTLAGIICADDAFIEAHLKQYLRHTGPALSPFNAWVILKSLESFELRVQAMSDGAAYCADQIAGHPKLGRLYYPGRKDHPQHELAMSQMTAGGSILAFEVKGGKEAAFRLQNALQVIDISNNLGDSKSLITHPATTTHQRLTPDQRAELDITDGLLRLSVGLEDPQDLAEDLLQALAKV